MRRWATQPRKALTVGGGVVAIAVVVSVAVATAGSPRPPIDVSAGGSPATAGDASTSTSRTEAPTSTTLQATTTAPTAATVPVGTPSTTVARRLPPPTTATTTTTITPVPPPPASQAVCRPIQPATSHTGAGGGTASILGEVVFTLEQDGDTDLWAMQPDAFGRRRLFARAGADTDPDLSPDGSKITWLHSEEQIPRHTGSPWRVTQVMVANVDGSDEHQLTPDGVAYRDRWDNPVGYGRPQWSADGTRVLYTRPVGEHETRLTVFEVVTARPDGTDVQLLYAEPAIPFQTVAWSPDGSRLAIGVDPHISDGGGYVVDLLTCSRRKLPWGLLDPAWSPDGRGVLDGTGSVTLVSADGSGTTTIARGAWPKDVWSEAVWSADGQRIIAVYVTIEYDSGLQREVRRSPPEIRSMRPDGSDVVVLGEGSGPAS